MRHCMSMLNARFQTAWNGDEGLRRTTDQGPRTKDYEAFV